MFEISCDKMVEIEFVMTWLYRQTPLVVVRQLGLDRLGETELHRSRFELQLYQLVSDRG